MALSRSIIVRNIYYAEGLIRTVLDKRAELYQGVRKILTDVTWKADPPGTGLKSIPSHWYGPNKSGQLDRNYLNATDIERCRLLLAKREDQNFTSVAVSMRNGIKESRSQGWCMNSYVVMRSKDRTIVEVQYRSTELILKFTGDMLWLPKIAERLEIKPDLYRFRFASCFISGVYFPYICAGGWDAIEFLETVAYSDPQLFKQGTRFFLRSSYKEDQHFPYSPENVAHRFGWKHLRSQMPRIREYLEGEHKKFGKPLPKLHHTEGEYIPRGQR